MQKLKIAYANATTITSTDILSHKVVFFLTKQGPFGALKKLFIFFNTTCHNMKI